MVFEKEDVPLRAITTEPICVGLEQRRKEREERRTMQRPQPSQPKKLSFSERKKWERIAQMTTDRAPMGVCGNGEHEGGDMEAGETHDDDGFDKRVG